MSDLPYYLTGFFKWWLIWTPKKIFRIAKRFIAVLNNQFSFTLNLRLFFTPLYGDYTFIGRLIGFWVRLVLTLFGLIFIGFLTLFSFVPPFVWWFLPIVIYYEIKLFVFPLYIAVYIIRVYMYRNIPRKKVSKEDNNNDKDILKSFRPKTKKYLNKLNVSKPEFLKVLLTDSAVVYILHKSELTDPEFYEKLANEAIIDISKVAKSAFEYALNQKARYVEVEHLFLGTIANISKVDTLLSIYSCTQPTLEQVTEWVVSCREALSKVYIWQDDYSRVHLGGFGKGLTGRVTPKLDSISEDFTEQVRHGYIKPIIGRQNEIKQVAQALSSSKVNVLITGEPGSGKTSLVKGIAYEVATGTQYESLSNKRIVSLEPGGLVGGTKSAGDLAEKINLIMKEVEASGNIILFIDEIHNLVSGAGGGESSEISSVFAALEPHLSSGRVQFIGATTVENYRKYIEPNGAFARLFQLIELPPSSKEESLQILESISISLESKYKVFITFPALKKIIELSEKLIHERVLPDKGIDILNRSVISVAKSTKILTSEQVAVEISEFTHVPVSAVSDNESKKLLNIENEMRKRVIGQDEAIDQIGAALKRARVGIRNESKPIASFLFVGTTGVGKTETAKTLAGTYFGDTKAMIRLDMSEYQQIDSINKLIGNNEGTSKGFLTEAVRTRPFSLILLDEIEKAYSSILLTFLQVLDDGRLTDTSGKVIDFTNTIIIATSNVGTRAIQDIAAKNGTFEEMKESAMRDVRDKFAPEFLNRFTGLIVFKPLTLDGVARIADIMLSSVKELANNKGVKLSFDPALINELVKRGYNPEWGARPLARLIEDTVESYLAVKLLSGELKSGDEVTLGLEVFPG